MPLLGNYSVLLKSPGRHIGGSTLSGDRAQWNAPGASRGVFVGHAGVSQLAGVPNGYGPGSAWVIPIKGGGMSGRGTATLTGGAANLAQGKALSGAGVATLTGNAPSLTLVVTLAGDGTITITGTGDLSGAVGLSGGGSITVTGNAASLALLSGLGGTATLTLTGVANLTGIAHLSGDSLPYTDLSPQALAIAVVNALIAGAPPGSLGATLKAANQNAANAFAVAASL